MPIAGNLDGPERDPVGDDVVAARVRDPRPAQARAHPVRLRQHLVPTAEQRLETLGREAVGLRTEHRADRRLTGIVRDRPRLHVARLDGAGREQAELVALPERAPLDPAHATPQVGRPRPQHERHVEPTGNADVRPHARASGAEPDDVARLHRDRAPPGRALTVHGHRHVGAGDRDGAGAGDLEARADQRALEGGRRVGIADEAIGEHERESVHGTRRRDAVAHLAGAAEVLHGGLRARVEDPDHAITGR